ncbi:MAG: hypothetical protein FJ368_03985 [Pelagibacterales bacterium]|nr:hypothetical protein [Pelagibacterales bacterium]
MDSNALRRQNAIGPGHGNSIPAGSQQNSQANESQLFASEDVNSDVVEVVISSLSNTKNSVQTQVSDLTFSQPSKFAKYCKFF